MDVNTSVTKTYSRKRGRTKSTSSPSALSPNPEQPEDRIRQLKRKKTTPMMHTVSGKTQIEDEDDPPGQSRMMRSKRNKYSKTQAGTSSAPSVHVSTDDSHSLAQPQRNVQRDDTLKMSLTPEINSEMPLTLSLGSLAHGQTLPGSSKLNAFKRTNSQLQKENVLSRPNLLASPFHIAPSSSKTHRTVKHPSGKLALTSKMARRPSAGVPDTHSSASISFRRRPSGSHALQQKSVGNHDWLVPPSQHFQPSNPDSGQDNTELGVDQKDVRDVDINLSSFSPQCYSTPLIARRLPIEVAPTTPVSVKPLRLSENNQLEAFINGSTCTTIAQGNLETSASISFLGTTSPGSRKLIHLPHDSIFSSFDFSTSAAGIKPNITGSGPSPSRQGKVTPQGPASSHTFLNPTNAISQPEGEELQNMFSVLGLGGGFEPQISSGLRLYFTRGNKFGAAT